MSDMSARAALSWLPAHGWLVLAGAAGGSEAIRARALSVAAADGAVAVLACAGENAAVAGVLDEFEDLGAQSGYIVDAFVEDDETLRSLLAEAGIVVVGAVSDAAQLREALTGAPGAGIRMAWQRGALVLLEGLAAMHAGAWLLCDDARFERGLAWLPGALVLPGMRDAGASPAVRALLTEQPAAVALGIGPQSALALGPDGALEIWGAQQVSIVLGPAWQASE